jgi:hypothetical protein
MDSPSTSANTVDNTNLSGYKLITSLDQLPTFNPILSSLNWTKCAITTFTSHPTSVINDDPYLDKMTKYFINTKVIVSAELCESIPFCDPLWLALELSNRVKSHQGYNNQYIHPIKKLDIELHKKFHLYLNEPLPTKYVIKHK